MPKDIILITTLVGYERNVCDNIRIIKGVEEVNPLISLGNPYDVYAITTSRDENALNEIYHSIRETEGVLSAEKSRINT